MRLQAGRKLRLYTTAAASCERVLEFFVGTNNIIEYTFLPSGVLEVEITNAKTTEILTRQFFCPQYLLRVEDLSL